MPIYKKGSLLRRNVSPATECRIGKSPDGYGQEDAKLVRIGLINNMPDAALESTERQFLGLLDSAASRISVQVSFFALPDVPRNEAGRQHIKQNYSDLDGLWKSDIDGLIVTGREPRTANLKDEPYWESLTRVLEWAKDNTHSTIWSCLAAHAAILHMDSIVRRRSDQKRCGVFDCIKLCDHPLTAGLSSLIKTPHSRWNDIPEDELRSCGYNVLTQAQGAGADIFVKQGSSLFVFLQGHPEYESDTLLLEYRRDVRRYLTGETDIYPSMPHHYFDPETEAALRLLQGKATLRRKQDLLAEVAALDGKSIGRTWHSSASRLYGNWLSYLYAQKERSLAPSTLFKEVHAGERA